VNGLRDLFSRTSEKKARIDLVVDLPGRFGARRERQAVMKTWPVLSGQTSAS
jgi:hypothetical protein